MLHKTRGIVFKYFKYRDTSIIVKIFTEEFGIQTYIVNGVRSKSTKSKIALFQPLTLLDLVVYKKSGAEINRISEIKCTIPFHDIPTDIRKTTIAIFMAEVLYKSVQEEGDVSEMFQFIYHSIEILDHLEGKTNNFHLQFLLKLSRYLGFGVDSFTNEFAFLSDQESTILHQLLSFGYEEQIAMSNQQRRTILDGIIHFYKLHVDSLNEINSINVLHELF